MSKRHNASNDQRFCWWLRPDLVGMCAKWVSPPNQKLYCHLPDGSLIMTWDDATATYRAVIGRHDEWWSGVQYVSEGTQPNLMQGGTYGTLAPARSVSMSNTGPPNALQVSDEQTPNSMTGPKSLASLPESYGRKIVVARSLPERSERFPLFSLELSQISVKLADGSRLWFWLHLLLDIGGSIE